MSRIRNLMKELNLQDELIETTMNKIEDVCRNHEVKTRRHFCLSLSGNGNGNGNGSF